MKQFKIRASAIGKIMAGAIGLTEKQLSKLQELQTRKNGFEAGDKAFKALTKNMEDELADLLKKQANPELPAGAKTYCEDWLKQQIYDRKKEFTSKYTIKGDAVEEKALEAIKKHLELPELSKNDEFFENDYSHGTPDVVQDDLIIDAKSSWDCFTFPLFENELPNEDYYWQGQGYMALVGRHICKFIFVLCDTPEKLIINEAKSYCYKNGFELSPEIVDEFRERMTYPNISDEFKIKVFVVERNDNDIKQIRERVLMCRQYIKDLIEKQKLSEKSINQNQPIQS